MSNDTQTLTLTEFVLARLAEDEADAETAANLKSQSPFARDDYGRLLVAPARVLAECEAKRRIVELHGGDFDAECHEDGYGLPRPDDCPTLRALALPYADHPDYREGWKL